MWYGEPAVPAQAHEPVFLRNGSYALLSNAPVVSKAVCFVHGFGGDPVATWKNFQFFVDAPDTPSHEWWRSADLFFYGYESRRLSIAEHGQLLLNFIDSIFPTIHSDLFEPMDLNLGIEPLPTPNTRTYSELYLVGHSMGGVTLREALLDRAAKADAHALEPGAAKMLSAEVRLFAPATFGAEPSGFLGILVRSLRSVALFGPLIDPFLQSNTIVRQLQAESKKLSHLREATERLARTGRYPALIAHVLFGENEQLVERDKLELDELEVPAVGKDHWSVCKPNQAYRQPIEFVASGRSRVKRQSVG